MSSVIVTDRRGGVFQVVITFNYGECDRLPYNQLRRINARIEQIPKGGIKATAEFNVRNPKDAKKLIAVLDLFGEDGSFVHGSPADPSVLGRTEPPPDDEEEPPIASATAVSARRAAAGTASAMPSPQTREIPASSAAGKFADALSPAAKAEKEPAGRERSSLSIGGEDARESRDSAKPKPDTRRGISEFFAAATAAGAKKEPEEADVEMEDTAEERELATEDEAEVEEEREAEVEIDAANWRELGDKAVAESLAANENRLQAISRVARAAGPRYTPAMIRSRLIRLLHDKYNDSHYVSTVMNRRDWRDVTPDEVEKVIGG